YRLALCKAPLPLQADFHERVKRIVEYSDVSSQELSFLILSVYEKPYLQLDVPFISSFINAIENKCQRIYWKVKGSAQDFIRRRKRTAVVKVGQLIFSSIIILIFVFNFTGLGKGQPVSFYKSEYPAYKDSVERISLRDNTHVKRPLALYN